MKRIILILLITSFGWISIKAQPPVSDGTIFISGLGVVNDYIYIENDFIYTSAETRISFPASFMYLRRDGQLLQGGNVTNTGRGFLSVYQEGSVNNFQYNYWCAPVGIYTTPGTGNIPFGLGAIYGANDVISSTVAGITTTYDGTASPFAISDSWIYRFQSQNTYGGWEYIGSANTLNAGEGFTMKGTSGTDANNYSWGGKTIADQNNVMILEEDQIMEI